MKIKFKKPSSMTGIITATILAVILILFIGAYSKREAFSSIDIFGGKEAVIESQNKDTDNDGLKDWQENLYKTDLNNPDTDGDGFLDGEEIVSNHNPLVKSPGDAQTFYPLPLGENYNITNKILSDDNVETLFAAYLAQKNQYIENNPQITDQEAFVANASQLTIQEMWKRAFGEFYSTLTDQAIAELQKIPSVFEIKVIDGDINISEDNTKDNVQKYINQVSEILYADSFFLKETASDAIIKAFKDDDFSQLDSMIKENDAKIEQAKNISVPSTWKEIHKQGLELTILIRNAYVSLRDIYNDPFKAYVATEKLENIPQSWNDLMGQAIDLAENQSIIITMQK